MAKDKVGVNAGQFYAEVGRLESGRQPRFYLGRTDKLTEDAARLRRARLREFWTRYLKYNRLNGYPCPGFETADFWFPSVMAYAKEIGKGATRLVYDDSGTDQMVLDAFAELNEHYDGVVLWSVPEHRRAGASLIASELHTAARLADRATAVEEVDPQDGQGTVHGWLTKYASYAKSTKLTFDADANETSEWGHNFARQIRFLSRGFADLPVSGLDYRAIESVVLHFANRPVSKRTGKPIAVKYASSLIKVWKAFIKWLPKQTAWRKPDEWKDAFGHRPKKNNVEKSARAIGTVAAYTVQQLPVIDRTLERRGQHHRGVADGLKFHVPAVFSPLQLDDNEVGVLINCQQIDPASAVVPLSELFADDQRVRADDVDLASEKTLQVASLAKSGSTEGGLAKPADIRACDFVDRHVEVSSFVPGLFARRRCWRGGRYNRVTTRNDVCHRDWGGVLRSRAVHSFFNGNTSVIATTN